jgi:PKD repeat protein/photosystem II stability/assembly factor-like uncharacterized protein
MKPIIFSFAFFILCLLLLPFIPSDSTNFPQKRFFPSPAGTLIIGEGEHKEFFEWKEQWIESMHNAAPGVNWRLMDQQARSSLVRSPFRAAGRELPVPAYWKEVGSNNLAGRTLLAEYDPGSEQIYVASDGGQIWKGTIGGDDWISLNDHFHLTGIHFLRRIEYDQGYRLMVCSGNWNITGFMFSDDDGLTWQESNGLNNITNWGFVKRAVIRNDADRTIYLLSQEWDYTHWNAITRIYVSTDQGGNFAILHTYDEPTFGGVDRFDLWAPYYGTGDVALVENNHFNLINSSHDILPIADIPVSQPSNILLAGYESETENRYYIMNYLNNESEFYGSVAGGNGWTFRGSVNEGPFMRNSFACSPMDPDILYFGGVNCYSSINGGVDWEMVNWWWQYYGEPETYLHADIPGINPFLNENRDEFTLVNTDGGTYVSHDHLENVENISLTNLRISQYYSSYTHRSNTHVSHIGSQDQGYQKSIQSADTSVVDYEQLISGDYGHLVSGDNGNSLWMVYPGFAMYNTNGVGNGQLVMWDFVGSGFFWMPYLMSDPEDPKSVYLAGGSTTSGSHIYHLTYQSGGITFEELPFDFSDGGEGQISAMAWSPVDPNYRYVLTSNGGFYSSADGGANWTKSEGFVGPGSHYFYGATMVASSIDFGTVYIAGSGYSNDGAFVTYDHGQSFMPITNGLPSTLIFEIALNTGENLLFAASELGPFLYDVANNQWVTLYDETAPAQTYWSVDYIPALNTARFGTYGRGLWDFVTGELPGVNYIVNHTNICADDSINFIDISQGDPVEWEWSFEGGDPPFSILKNPQGIHYEFPGDYDVKLVVRNLFGADSVISPDLIHVGSVPVTPGIPWGADTLYVNSPDTEYFIHSVDGASSYSWRLNPAEAGTISGSDTTGTVDWNDSFIGEAIIDVSAVNNCGTSVFSSGLQVTVLFNVGKAEPGDTLQVRVFPNPADEKLFVQINETTSHPVRMEIYDSNGTLRYSKEDGIAGMVTEIDVSRFQEGIYYLVIDSGKRKISEKIVVH